MGRIDQDLIATSQAVADAHGMQRPLAEWARGQLREAIEMAQTMYADAIAEGDLPGARMAAAGLARFVLNIGHPAWASRILDEVDRLAALGGDEPPIPMEVTLVAVVRGRIAEVRGDLLAAERILVDAVAWLDAEGEVFARDATRLAWGTTMAALSQESATAVVAEMEQLRSTTEHQALWYLAGIPLALAVGHLGDWERGVCLFDEATADWSMPHDHAQVLVRLAEMLLVHGCTTEAAERLHLALELLDDVGGSYWAARALCDLARTGTDDASVLRSRARLLSDGDVAFDRLFQQAPDLVVDLTGEARITRGGQPLAFTGRQAAFVALALVALGPRGTTIPDLAGALWPDADAPRVSHRMRTLLWQVRRALGADAWRLGRDGDRLWLDLRGVEVVCGDGPEVLLDGWPEVGDGVRRWLLGALDATGASEVSEPSEATEASEATEPSDTPEPAER